MRFLFVTLLVLLAGVSIALILRQDPGYVLISYGQWSVESSLALLLLVIVITFTALYYAIRATKGLVMLPARVRGWQERRRVRKAHSALSRGLLEMAEGRWDSAESTLIKSAPNSDNQLLHYLAAARAAQRQGAPQRRDHYLYLAHKSMPNADVAVGLTQAELQLAHHQMEQALATLTHLRSLAPRHPYVLRMLMKLYRELRDWAHLRDLLPELRKRNVLKDEEARRLEIQVYGELLDQAAARDEPAALDEAWARTPKGLRQEETLLLAYVRHLMARGADEKAEPLVREAIKKQWSDELVYVYGLLKGSDLNKQLATAEGWLKTRSKNPVLLLTLGRLCLRNRLWGKARVYFESSIGSGPRPETYKELGALLEQLGETDAAMDCFRRGMILAVGNTGRPALPGPDLPERFHGTGEAAGESA